MLVGEPSPQKRNGKRALLGDQGSVAPVDISTGRCGNCFGERRSAAQERAPGNGGRQQQQQAHGELFVEAEYAYLG